MFQYFACIYISVSATYKGVFTEKHLSFTETPELITTLPEGPQFDNYRMTIWVRVADRMGSITKMEIGVVQVTVVDIHD